MLRPDSDRMGRSGQRWSVLGVTLMGAALGGCHALNATEQGKIPHEGSAELVRYISDQPFVTAEPAYRAIYALWKGEAFDGDFDALTTKMRTEKLIGKDWDYEPNRYLERGTIAFMVCRACRIKGGINWALTGLGRYAWRELQFKGIAGDGSEYGLMSGGEFVGMLLRAEDYLQRTGARDMQRPDLGSPGG